VMVLQHIVVIYQLKHSTIIGGEATWMNPCIELKFVPDYIEPALHYAHIS